MVYLFGLPDGSKLQQRWGRVVTGEVVMDGKQQLMPGSNLCSSPILRSPGNLVHTRSGEVYSLFGEGQVIELPTSQLERLRMLESAELIASQFPEHWREI